MAKGLLLLGTVTLLLAGCAKNNKATIALKEEPYAPTNHQSLDSMDAAPSDNSSSDDYSTADGYSSSGGAANYASSYDQPAAQPVAGTSTNTYAASSRDDEVLSPTGGQTYVVRKGDTLFALARRFYGKDSRWRDIYNANRGQISNPDRLYAGTKLIIP